MFLQPVTDSTGVDLLCKAMTRICWSSTAVVVRGRPDRGRSLTSPVSLQRRMRLLIVAGDTWKVVATLRTDRPDST